MHKFKADFQIFVLVTLFWSLLTLRPLSVLYAIQIYALQMGPILSALPKHTLRHYLPSLWANETKRMKRKYK